MGSLVSFPFNPHLLFRLLLARALVERAKRKKRGGIAKWAFMAIVVVFFVSFFSCFFAPGNGKEAFL